MLNPHPDALVFTIERRTLVYSQQERKVVRFDPARLVADCPMCEWYVTGPDTDGGLFIVTTGRYNHATTVHPEALHHGGMVLDHDPLADVARELGVRMGATEAEALEALRRAAQT